MAQLVDLRSGVCISVHPSSKRAAFPYPDLLPPFRVLRSAAEAAAYLRLPTAAAAAAAAAALPEGHDGDGDGGGRRRRAIRTAVRRSTVVVYVTALVYFLSQLRHSGASSQRSHSPSCGRIVAALGASFVVCSALLRLVGARCSSSSSSSSQPTNVEVTARTNVSSDPDGPPCIVTARALIVTHSHAGTHADTPAHFYHPHDLAVEPAAAAPVRSTSSFPDECYTGPAVIVRLPDDGCCGSTITPEVVERVVAASRKDVDWSSVERLLLWTRRYDDAEKNEDVWTNDFTHFSKAGAAALRAVVPKLKLVGLDTPSVDAVTAAPIAHHAHGVFVPLPRPPVEGPPAVAATTPVAILENLTFQGLCPSTHRTSCQPSSSSSSSCDQQPIVVVTHGVVQTVFNPMAEFEDAKGCIVTFFPRRPSA